ncbi:MAG: hypothetical protein KF857_06340 [Fimbriimonadaceae bacterium]|nr:hypothetical protein [Fimbriimonadaceae bacterium]
MPVGLPGYVIKLGHDRRAWRGGEELLHPPTRATEQLLYYLAEKFPARLERRAVAARLYPEASERAAFNALRQTVHRLKQWLGAEAVVSDAKSIGLSPDLWEVESQEVEPGTYVLKQDDKPVNTGSFKDLVMHMATLDKEVARGLLLGGREIAINLNLPDLYDLLKAATPTSMKEAGAYEHLAFYGRYFHKTALFNKAIAAHTRVYRHAGQNRRHALMSNAAAWLLFTYVEMGDMATARQWLPEVVGSDRSHAGRLFAANAMACCLWNDMEIDDTYAEFEKAAKVIYSASRSDQSHYWSNYAVFAAESGRFALSEECQERAASLRVSGLDTVSKGNCLLASALCQRHAGDFAGAVSTLEQYRAEEAARGQELGVVYANEALAETRAMMGQHLLARKLWATAERTRAAGGGMLTPRLKAMRARTFGLLA